MNNKEKVNCPLCGSENVEECSMQEYPHNNDCNALACLSCGYKDYKELFPSLRIQKF